MGRATERARASKEGAAAALCLEWHSPLGLDSNPRERTLLHHLAMGRVIGLGGLGVGIGSDGPRRLKRALDQHAIEGVERLGEWHLERHCPLKAARLQFELGLPGGHARSLLADWHNAQHVGVRD